MATKKKSQLTRGPDYNPFLVEPIHEPKSNHETKIGSEHLNPFSSGKVGFFPNDSTWNDPWSTDSFSKNEPWSTKPDLVETSFDASLEYSVTSDPLESTMQAPAASSPDPFGGGAFASGDLFPSDSDIIMKLSPPREAQHRLQVNLEERLSILFDDVSPDPTCGVIGFIYVTPPKKLLNSFCLTVRDRKGHVERWEEQSDICTNITATVPHLALDQGDQVFRVSLKDQERLEAPVVGYSCLPKLKPIPILLKTKVHRDESQCRVGIRIRANPNNGYIVTQIAILMVVPPEVDGEKVAMSREGGIWDEMKRTISWTLDQLQPGEIMDIQAQFGYVDGVPKTGVSKFPVLVRCAGKSLFSRIELNADYTDDDSSRVNLRLEQSTRILYRKV